MQQHFEKIISAFSLNFSGILDSPYEFYSNQFEKQERQMSEICHTFISKLPNYDQKTFKWEIGKIDQLYQRERYTPIYNQNVGVQNGRLINRSTFEQRWEEKFKHLPEGQFAKEHKDNMKLFDFIMYSTLVAYSNQLKDLDKIHFQQCSAEKYCAIQAKFHQKSFVNEQKKISKTISTLAKRPVDIIFVQQTNENFRKAVGQCGLYFLVHKKGIQSAILIKKDSFHNMHPQIELGFETANWNDDTIWCKLGKLILVSAHLTSKPQKNQQQVEQMIKDLHQFKKSHPQYHILVGIDANSFIDFKNQHDFHIFPTKEQVATTYKERTWMQPQIRKANVIARSCKDHIISDLNLNTCEVTLINGSNLSILIPTETHPYDHYLVSTHIHTEL